MSRRYWEALNYYGSFKVQIIPFVLADNVFKSFYHCGPRHHKYFIVFNAINRFNIGENGQKTPLNEISHTILSSCIAMLLSPGSSPSFQKHFSTGRWLKRQRRGGKRARGEVRGRAVWVTVALPLHLRSIGDSSVWRAVFVLYCYWWHFGVTVSRWNGSPPTSQPAAAQPVEQWGPDESGLELRRPQLGATP